ncbi:MAG: M15 family metallopeptidase [Bacteroidetes bacterium]|nr:M15 family metallopeptidase [Bacteroidota bacterium]
MAVKNFLILFSLLNSFRLSAQTEVSEIPISRYGLPVINDIRVYKTQVAKNPENRLLDVRGMIPDARFIITYATDQNFLKRKIYPSAELFLRKPAAEGLVKAAEILRKQGLGLVLYDGYRPYAVTVLFYEEVGDTTFVADPRKGSKHNRGMAIDLSMYNLKTGKLLEMPSGYDEASERAYHEYAGGSDLAKRNRQILRSAMEEAGFSIFKYEWWHYDFKGWGSCPTYDLWHDEIRKAGF